jgi:hypothetical protein
MTGGRIRHALDTLLGRGVAAITVPPLDGAFRPNSRLDEATWRIACDRPDCLLVAGGRIVVSSGQQLLRVDNAGVEREQAFPKDITCVGATSDGGIIVGLQDGQITIIGGRYGGRSHEPVGGMCCLTAMTVVDDTLFVCNGSATNAPSEWRRDLLQRNATGSVWRLSLASGSRNKLVGGLAFPSGIVAAGDSLVVSESWKHRLLKYDLGKNVVTEMLGDLPGYPGRLSPGSGGCYWLSLFAPRSQLVEFVLHEPEYRKRMMAEVEADFWVSPTLRAGKSFYEILQGGGVKHLGILKAWAPTRSYGLLARLDRDFQPLESYHSRADGRTHGVTSAVEHDGKVHASAKGDNVIVALDCATPGGGST